MRRRGCPLDDRRGQAKAGGIFGLTRPRNGCDTSCVLSRRRCIPQCGRRNSGGRRQEWWSEPGSGGEGWRGAVEVACVFPGDLARNSKAQGSTAAASATSARRLPQPRSGEVALLGAACPATQFSSGTPRSAHCPEPCITGAAWRPVNASQLAMLDPRPDLASVVVGAPNRQGSLSLVLSPLSRAEALPTAASRASIRRRIPPNRRSSSPMVM